MSEKTDVLHASRVSDKPVRGDWVRVHPALRRISRRRTRACVSVNHSRKQDYSSVVGKGVISSPFRSALIAVPLNQDVDHVAVLIHGTPEILFLAVDSNEHFVQVPPIAETALTPL